MQKLQKLSKTEKNGMNGIKFFFSEIRLFVNLILSASFYYKRKASKVGREYKGDFKSQFPDSLVKWEKFRSTSQTGFQKTQFSIFMINWEKLRSPARATFKNPKTSL